MAKKKKTEEIIYQILNSIIKNEQETGREITRKILQKEIITMQDRGDIDKNIKAKDLSRKIIEIKKAVEFLEERISSLGLFNVDILVEKAKDLSKFEHQTLQLAAYYIFKKRKE